MKAVKESGLDWLDNIPSGWKIERMKNQFLYTKGLNITKADLTEAGLAVVSYGQIHSKENSGTTLKDDLLRFISSENIAVTDKSKLSSGDIVFADTSEDYAGLGNAVYMDRDRDTDTYAGYHTIIARPNEPAYAKYFAYLFKSEAWRSQLCMRASGIKVFSVTQRMLNDVTLIMPPSVELPPIISYLDDRCAKIDTIIAEAKTSIEEYKELKQAVIYDAVTKGLDKNSDMKDSGIPAIGKVNEKFKIAKIGELQEGLTDGTHGTYQRLDSGELLLSSKNVQNEGLVVGNNESFISTEDYKAIVANGFPQKNDILLCCIGASIGRCILYPYNYPIAFQRSVIFIRTNHWMLPKFMLYSLQSPSSIMQENVIVNQSAQAGFYQGLVKQLYVTVPSINEQNKIVSYLDKKIKNIDDVISTKESLIEDLEYYRKSLIYEVVTGKRKVVD